MGDVTSSLVLAHEFRRRGYNVWFMVKDDDRAISLVKKNRFQYSVVDNHYDLQRFLKSKKSDIAILNQMNTPMSEALILRKNVKLLVTVEDTGKAAAIADMRFNVLYPAKKSFIDFNFMPLSDVFQKKRMKQRIIRKHVKNIIIMQGGSDTRGFIPRILKALYGIPTAVQINVIIGPGFKNEIELKKALDQAPRVYNIIRGENDLSDLMLNADMAVSAGGNTLFELACLGVPAVVVCAEPFEAITANRMQKHGFGVNLGFKKDPAKGQILSAVNVMRLDYFMRKKMNSIGKKMIDGHGAERIITEILNRV